MPWPTYPQAPLGTRQGGGAHQIMLFSLFINLVSLSHDRNPGLTSTSCPRSAHKLFPSCGPRFFQWTSGNVFQDQGITLGQSAVLPQIFGRGLQPTGTDIHRQSLNAHQFCCIHPRRRHGTGTHSYNSDSLYSYDSHWSDDCPGSQGKPYQTNQL